MIKSLKGGRFGRWTVISKATAPGNAKWNCRCDCGREYIVTGQSLQSGTSTGCRYCSGKSLVDLTGQRFGNLTVVSLSSTSKSETLWNCLCDCGEKTAVSASNLVRGTSKSCGCRGKTQDGSLAGLYRMDIAGLTYFGETVNIPRRKKDHWDELISKRHHNILLRRLVCIFGIDAVTFTVISQGPQWTNTKTRKTEEMRLIQSTENAINTAGLLSVYATHLRLPDKTKYRSRTLYIKFVRGVVEVYDDRHGNLIGIERAKGKLATGYYDVDDRSFLNVSANTRRPSPRRGSREVLLDGA